MEQMPIELRSALRRFIFAGACFVFAGLYLYFALRAYIASRLAATPNPSTLNEAIRLEPSNAEYRDLAGRSFSVSGISLGDAIANYGIAVRLNPYMARYWLDLASTYQIEGRMQEQGENVQHAVEADPTTPHVAWEAANFFLIQGELEKALHYFHVVVANDPDSVDFSLLLCWRATGDADRILDQVLPPRPDRYLSFLRLLISKQEVAARELIQSFGYTSRPSDSAFGLGSDVDYQRYAEQREKPGEFRAQLAKGQPPFVYFWYRQSPRYLETFNARGRVAEDDPPPHISGMAGLQLDTLGRLIYFSAAPPQVEETPASSTGPDPRPLFAAAGLDPARFTSTEPKWTPLSTSDIRAAWTGFYPDAPDVPLRVEAAWWRLRPVYFQMIGPWTRPERVQPFQETAGQTIENWVILSLICTGFVVAALLAWRNFRLGRGDTRGASRLAVFMFCLSLLAWLFAAKHVPTRWEYSLVMWAISAALFVAALYWLLYVALEPYVRRRWPQSLISWSRLLAGGFRDPLVGGQVLIGIAVGVAMDLGFVLHTLLRNHVGGSRPETYL